MTPSSMKASATQLKESAQVLDESAAIHPKQQQYYLIMVLCLILKPSVTRDYPELSISGVSGWNMNDISKLDMNPDAFTRRQAAGCTAYKLKRRLKPFVFVPSVVQLRQLL